MITPAFDLSQDPEYLTIIIRVPYTRTSEFDLYVDGTDFKFYAKPYFLRLTLPGRIVEDGRERAKFDIDDGLFTLRVPKETAGEHFDGLQMLTGLLAPKGSRCAKPLVGGSEHSGGLGDEEDDEEEDEFEWQVEQEVYKETSEEELRSMQMYGFGNKRSGVFARLQEELSDVIDVRNPEQTSAGERRRARLEAEASAFSADHYLADLFEDDEIKGLLKFVPWWEKLGPSAEQQGEAAVAFTDEEKEQLRKFNNRSYLLDKAARHQAWLSLLDILLAYCYEVRSTEGEHTVESSWTIRKLSGTLSWLETYGSLQEVLASFGRRVLCYPLYRHFGMVSAAIGDATKILQSGKVCVLKCLLDVHKVFRANEPAYILNDLYVTDYCIWIQRVKSKKMAALTETLRKASLRKEDLDLELEELEAAAQMVAEDEEEAGAGESGPVSSRDTSSSSSSADESGASEAEEGGCADFSEEGGGGGGGETGRHNPLQPPHGSSGPPSLQEPSSSLVSAARTEDAPPASGGCRQLIQELGERVAEELKISQDSRRAAEGGGSPPHGATGTLLEPSPRRNPLLIVTTQEDVQLSNT
eukprot:XP_003973782.1 PREDICTED: protein SHQ1 homolog isoform X2 [Takifugu rubripes]